MGKSAAATAIATGLCININNKTANTTTTTVCCPIKAIFNTAVLSILFVFVLAFTFDISD
jgi:hypothetical protein